MAEIQAEIEADRKKLEFAKDMAEEEKRLVEAGLQEKEAELARAQWVGPQLSNEMLESVQTREFYVTESSSNLSSTSCRRLKRRSLWEGRIY